MEDCPKCNIVQRLKKIEDQVKGIQRMINEEKNCVDILIQVSAVRAAINKVGVMVFENHTKECLKKAIQDKNEDEMIQELIKTMAKFTN